MQNFSIEKTDIEDLVLINPFLYDDQRGFFIKNFEKNIFKENDIDFSISESFTSKSMRGVIRGLHFQENYPQTKLVGVSVGTIYDVVVDLRKKSKTYGHWRGFELSEHNNKILYVPKGFAHGFIALSDIALVSYFCDGEYIKEYDSGIVWNDADLNIDWNLEEIGGAERIIISEKDKKLQTFRDFKGFD